MAGRKLGFFVLLLACVESLRVDDPADPPSAAMAAGLGWREAILNAPAAEPAQEKVTISSISSTPCPFSGPEATISRTFDKEDEQKVLDSVNAEADKAETRLKLEHEDRKHEEAIQGALNRSIELRSSKGYSWQFHDNSPTISPTSVPTPLPTPYPTGYPTYVPTAEPTWIPTYAPTAYPTREPTEAPTEPVTIYEPTEYPTPFADHNSLDPIPGRAHIEGAFAWPVPIWTHEDSHVPDPYGHPVAEEGAVRDAFAMTALNTTAWQTASDNGA